MRQRSFSIILIVLAAASIALLWSTNVPLGVPGEWTWARIPYENDAASNILLGGSLALVALLAYLSVVWIGSQRLTSGSRVERAFWLAALSTAGFFWLSLLQESPPDGYRSSKAIQVLYYRGSSGYFHEARYSLRDVPSFLETYEDRMAEGDVLHVGTHPPGLFLFHRAVIELCRQSPALTDLVLSTQPASAADAAALIAQQAQSTPTPLLSEDNAALWLAALITQAVGVLTMIPLYLLIRRSHSPQISFLTASLWPLVPALAIFLPKSDALYPFIGLMFLYCWLEGCRLQSWWRCALAGLLFLLGMALSLAILPVGLLALLLGIWEARSSGEWKWLGLSAAVGGAAFLIGIATLWLTCDINLFNVWRWNLVNHAAFYDQFPRTKWKWLLVNPLELSLAVGLPIILLAIAGFRREFAPAQQSSGDATVSSESAGNALPGVPRFLSDAKRRKAYTLQIGPYICCTATFVLLWLSGKNAGEAARLWLFLMPWVIWLAAGALASREGDQPSKLAFPVIALQAVVCIATVMRITGFA